MDGKGRRWVHARATMRDRASCTYPAFCCYTFLPIHTAALRSVEGHDSRAITNAVLGTWMHSTINQQPGQDSGFRAMQAMQQ